MRQGSSKASSALFLSLFAMVFASLITSQPLRAQGKPGPSLPTCIPSDLNDLIVPEGNTVQVHENKEEYRGKESAAILAAPSGHALSYPDMQQRKGAYKILSKEARRGNLAAMVNLAVASLAGWGAHANAGAALYWLHAAADHGYARAYYNLGILFFKGCGVRQDLAEAFHFFELGAHAGYTPAQMNLGYFYDRGLVVTQDHGAAASWYRQAAESSEAQAQYNLADLYLRGEGVPLDESMAFEWFQKAALQGHAGAQVMAGSMLADGRGAPKDLAAACFWLFAAKLQGDDRVAATLQVLEKQLTLQEIEQAKARAQLLVGRPETAKASAFFKVLSTLEPSH